MTLYNTDVIVHILSFLDEITACHVAVVLRLDETLIKKLFSIQRVSLDEVARHGFVDLLRFLCQHKYDNPRVSREAIHDVCSRGHVDVLQCLYESDIAFPYSEKAMGNATKHDRIAVLDWFIASDVPLKYFPGVIDIAASRGNVASMQWWLDSGLHVTGRIHTLKKAIRLRRSAIVDLWLQSVQLPKP